MRVQPKDLPGPVADRISVKAAGAVDRHIGNLVRMRRLVLGISQEKLAASIGITFPQVQKYENGTNRISVSRLQQIAEVLGVEPAIFFDGLPRADGSPRDPVEPARPDVQPLRPEAQELMQAWGRIRDPELRGRVLDLVKTLAAQNSAH